MRRREFLQAALALTLAGCAGATAAKYVRMWDPRTDVTLVERGSEFVSCPTSNLVLGGSRTIGDITRPLSGLRKYGVNLVSGETVSIDAANRIVTLSGGNTLPYDRLVVSPGVDFLFNEIEGSGGQERILHAWKAGPQTVALRRQLEAMRDGGVYVLSIPAGALSLPAGRYERTCQVAHHFKQAKPRCKVLVLDANPDVTSKGPLFKRAWLLHGRERDPSPVMNNSCYSFVSDREVIHVASVHQYDAGQSSITPVKGAGGVSSARSELEG